MARKIKVYFMLPRHCDTDENVTSEAMRRAFELCCQNQLIPEWISEDNYLSIDYGKTDIVVFDEFKGEAFKQLEKKRCFSIAGPWCIITCLLDGVQVPNNGAPVYNMAMNKLVVTASNYSVERKKFMKERIEMMGGIFTIHITSSVTHLVTNCVRTQKYAVANERNIIVMLESWIEDVWIASLTRNIKATDEEFLKNKCPVFNNLRLCCTGFEVYERTKMIKLIGENGASYSGKFVSSSTDILICNPGSPSEKFNVARKAKVPCLKIDWLYDSIKRGYCLPDHEYVIKISSSTPTKNSAPLNVDFSMMSAISGSDNHDPFKTSASDTINVSLYNTDKKLSDGDKENKLSNIIDNIDLKQVKQAGTFLAECSVYLTGFTPDKREKLCRILKCAGATRYDVISDRVTQIITGNNNLDSNELKLLKGSIIPIVSVEWLLECVNQHQPVSEEPFTIKSNIPTNQLPSSPLSQKGLTLLQIDTSKTLNPPVQQSIKWNEPEQDVSQLYMNKLRSKEEDTLTKLLQQANKNENSITISRKEAKTNNETEDSEDNTFCALFEGKSFKLIEQTEEDIKKLTSIIEDEEGDIQPTTFKGITDYIVAPLICNPLKHTATEIVNNLWIYECNARQELLPLDYYHHPIYKSESSNVLENCVITISGYLSYERTYIMNLIQYLGATYQDKFARVTLPDHSVRASTHLICYEATGSKYLAAVRWNRPAVSHKWLLRCAETKSRCDEKQFSLTEKTSDGIDNTSVLKVEKSRRAVQTSVAPIPSPVSIPCPVPNPCPVTIPSPVPIASTTVTVSNKRDCEGRKISPLLNERENLDADDHEYQKSEKKLKSACNSNGNLPDFERSMKESEDIDSDDVSLLCSAKSQDEDSKQNSQELTFDGRKMSLNKFMLELRQQGLFDMPSPAPKLNAGTPIQEVVALLRREGKIPQNEGTPQPNKKDKDVDSGGSQGTPVGKYLRSLQARNIFQTTPNSATGSNYLNSSIESPNVRPFYDIKTPETPLGRFLGEDNPSPETRKHWKRFIDTFPHYKCHDRPAAVNQRRLSTPLSEVKKQAWAWLLRDKTLENDNPQPGISKDDEKITIEQSETQRQLSNQIDQFQNKLQQNRSGHTRNSILNLDGSTPQKIASDDEHYIRKISALRHEKDSQVNSVEWEEPIESNIFDGQMSAEASNNFILRKFMFSSLDQSVRQTSHNTIKSLGGEVSDLNYFDLAATHVISSIPTRNEKILSSMASGKWIVHYSYVEKSGQEGGFLNEELYEYGNPKASENLSKYIENTPTMEAMHWWRLKIFETKLGAFDGMRAVVFSKNKPALIRLIEAGDGVVINAEPPFDHNLDITHCFIDNKLKMDSNIFIPLAEQGIKCLNVLYLSNFLTNKTKVSIDEFIMPTLKGYYK